MRYSPNKPAGHVLLDLGLRPAEVRNQPAKQAVALGLGFLMTFVVLMVAMCAFVALAVATDLGDWASYVFAPLLVFFMFTLIVKAHSRAPAAVVKVRSGGPNQPVRLVLINAMVFLVFAALVNSIFLGILAVPGLLIAFLAYRKRDELPDLLTAVKARLEPGEVVIGDCVGQDPARKWKLDGGRLVVATDRRLIVARFPQKEDPMMFDGDYSRVREYTARWVYFGRAGALTIQFENEDGSVERVLLTFVASMNMLSIIAALEEHGVSGFAPPAPPAAVDEQSNARSQLAEVAEQQRAWRLMPDRAETQTRAFDIGMWLCLGLIGMLLWGGLVGLDISVVTGAAAAVLVVMPLIFVLCGYVSRTTWSIVYVVPLTLILTPLFFYLPVGDVALVMAFVALMALFFLPIGARLSRRIDRRNRVSTGSHLPEPR